MTIKQAGPLAALLLACLSAPALADDSAEAGGDASVSLEMPESLDFSTESQRILKVKLGDLMWLAPTGHFQFQIIPYSGSDARLVNLDPSDESGFRLRRTRLGLDGGIGERATFTLTADLIDEVAGGSALLDASVTYKMASWLWWRAGLSRNPFSVQLLTASANLTLIDRPLGVETLSPQRGLGLTAGGDVSFGAKEVFILGYQAMVSNGSTTVTQGNRSPGLQVGARLEFGFMGRTRLAQSHFEGAAMSFSGLPSILLGVDGYCQDGETVNTCGLSADLSVKWGGFALVGEWLFRQAKPDDRPTLPGSSIRGQVEGRAWYLQASGFVVANRIELAVRFERVDDNIHLDDVGDAQLLTGGINFYYRGNRFKTQLNYVRRDELEGPSLDNDAVWLQTQVQF